MVHHTLEPNMNHETFIGMSGPIRKTYAFLTHDATMAEEVDRVMEAAIRSKLPGFIYVPTDVVTVPVDRSRLETPLRTRIENLKEVEDIVVSKVLDLIKQSSKPAVLADVLTIRHGGGPLVRKLIDLTHFPGFSAPLSKGVIDETSSYYNGLYNGKGKHFQFNPFASKGGYEYVQLMKQAGRRTLKPSSDIIVPSEADIHMHSLLPRCC